ncbi:hypothetical protein PRZ48_008621 [Zasmidium cellare]|uniref:Uncharacterized protein n=1 Tax=Zasmidium cellare TaxID=395010 RepID=A0ABR0EFZ0_ZASCE|nr:hypothetical protein PRZ48_008621 [Zasmidium cellare]
MDRLSKRDRSSSPEDVPMDDYPTDTNTDAAADTIMGSTDGDIPDEMKPRESALILTETVLGGAVPQNYAESIPLILAGIKRLLGRYKNLQTRGRFSGVRINYIMKQAEIPSIAARLQTAITRGGFSSETRFDGHNQWEACEWLLRPLFYWNRRHLCGLVPGLKPKGVPNGDVIPKREIWAFDDEGIQMRLRWLPELDSLPKIFPGDWSEDPEEKVHYLMTQLHAHLHGPKIDEAKLSHHAKAAIEEVDQYFAHSQQPKKVWGLAKRLRNCFSRKGLSAEEYIDLLDQQFYSFQQYVSDNSAWDPFELTRVSSDSTKAQKEEANVEQGAWEKEDKEAWEKDDKEVDHWRRIYQGPA